MNININSDCSETVNYDFADFPVCIRTALLSQYPNFSAVSHWHDDVEFIYVFSGNMYYNINGIKVKIKEKCGIFVNSRQLHFGYSDDETECEFLCVLLHPFLLCSSKFIEQKYVQPIITNSAYPYLLLENGSSVLKALKEMYLQGDSELRELKIQNLFFQIWTEIFKIIPIQKNVPSKSHQLSQLKEMIGFIQSNYKNKITLSQICSAGSLSKSSCTAIFMRFLNKTPIEYLIVYRLQKSIELLRTTDMSITEISFETGFSGSSYYAETFRKHMGCTPKEYRTKSDCLPLLTSPKTAHSPQQQEAQYIQVCR